MTRALRGGARPSALRVEFGAHEGNRPFGEVRPRERIVEDVDLVVAGLRGWIERARRSA